MTPDRDPPDLLRELEHHRPFWVRVLCFAGAGVFFVLGIVGWLIPVLTGIPFYVAGLALLALASDSARHLINRLERRLPRRLRWAVRRGVRDGWLNRTGLAPICSSFGNASETPTHPSAARRCSNLERCFAGAASQS